MVYIPSGRLQRETLGELPAIPVGTTAATGASQYDALASGKTVGGNFQAFQDGAAQGWFSNNAAGYAQYLAYNALGSSSPAAQALPPSYVGWYVATIFANAVVSKAHVGNNLSPLYDVPTAITNGRNSVNAWALNLRWTAAQRDEGQAAFSSNFSRLLTKWGYSGAVGPVAAAVMIEHPYFKSLGKIVLVDKATVAYDGPDRDPTVAARGGREFAITGGGVWKWGATPVRVELRPQLQLMLTKAVPPSPGDGSHFAVVAYRVNLVNPTTRATEQFGHWVKWNAMVDRVGSDLVSGVFLEDARRSAAAPFALAELDQVLAGSVGAPPPANLGDTFVTWPPPKPTTTQPPSSGSSGPLVNAIPKPPAVTPAVTGTGPGVDLWTDAPAPSGLYTPAPASLGPSLNVAPGAEGGTATTAAPSSSGSKGPLLAVGVGLVALMALGGGRKGRR